MPRMLFASDFDGTLIMQNRIAPDLLHAIAAFRAQGGLFGVCSGRDPGTLKAELKKFGVTCDFLILMNGARIEAGAQCLHETHLQNFTRLLPLLRQNCLFFTVIGNEEAHMFCQANLLPAQVTSGAEQVYVQAIGRTHVMRERPEDLSAVYQISCRTPDSQAAVALADQLHALGCSAWPNCEYVDIVPDGVNKAGAVAWAAQYFGIPDNCVYTAGDGRNDMEMLSRFHGFAMAQAESCVQQAARQTVSSVPQALATILKEIRA